MTATKINKCVIKLLIITFMQQNLSLIAMLLKKCVIKLSILFILQYSLFLNAIRLKKCVTKLLIDVILHFFMFLIDIKLKKFGISEDPFILVYCANKYKTQRMSHEAVHDSLAALKFFSDWFRRAVAALK